MKSVIITILLTLCGSFTAAADEALLKEVNEQFTYNGQPIHPFLLEKFSNWMSDYAPPVTVTLDIAAAMMNRNQFSEDEIQKRENGWVWVERGADVNNYESFGYRWLGRLANGLHVLEVAASGGGSGTFMDLLFVKLSEAEFDWEKGKHKQILMTIVKTHALGDRYEGEIRVSADKVFIPKSTNQYGGGSLEKDIELTF